VTVSRACKITNIFQKYDGWTALLDDTEDVPVKSASGFFHPTLRTTLGERLTWKAGTQNVMVRNVHNFIIRIIRDVTKRVYSPITLVDRSRRRINLNRIDAFTSHGGKSSVKPANSRKEVDECELGPLHEASLDPSRDMEAHLTLIRNSMNSDSGNFG